MDTTNMLLIILIALVVFLAMSIAQKRNFNRVMIVDRQLPHLYAHRPTWWGPRPGRRWPKFRRRWYW